jgi:hypothetical protein
VEEIFICGVPYTHTFIPSLLDPFFLRVYMEHRVQVAFSDQFEVFGCARRGAGSSIYIRFTFYNFHSRSLWIAILEVQTAQKARRHPRCRFKKRPASRRRTAQSSAAFGIASVSAWFSRWPVLQSDITFIHLVCNPAQPQLRDWDLPDLFL